MTNIEINKKVTELLGKCWHEWNQRGPGIAEWNCTHCNEYISGIAGSLIIQSPNKNYSESIADAWKLVKLLNEKEWVTVITIDSKEGRYCRVWKINKDGYEIGFEVEAESAPTAICLAFIKTMDKS